MKLLLVVVLSLVALSSQQRRYNVNVGDNGGQYRPDNSGAYSGDDGRYQGDNSGQYVPDDSGQYAGDYEKYKHQEEKYKHQGDQFGPNGGGGGGSGGAGGSGGSGASGGSGGSGNYNPGAGGSGNRRPGGAQGGGSSYKPPPGSGGGGINPAGGFGPAVPLQTGSAAGLYDNRNYAIIKKIEAVEDDGYHYEYETENKIFGEEQGKLHNKGTDQEAMKAAGYYKYTGPDNIIYHVEYTADENGFVPQAAHLPTPPPVPQAILRSLEYQRQLGVL